MDRRLKTAIWDRNLTFFALNRTEKLVTTLVLMMAALSASATSPVSRVSCGNNSFTAPGNDACSVYLTARTSGRMNVKLSSNNAAVTVPANVTVKSGASTTGFKATVGAVTTAQTATITAQGGGTTATFSITLSPAATGTPALSLNSTSIGFGSVEVNTAAEQSLTLTSTGTAAATLTSAGVSGTGFSVTGATFPVTLNPGQAMTVEVGFDPASDATFSGQLSFGSNASTPTVTLSGVGTAPLVGLSWTAPSSPSDPIVGYNVYRALSGTTSFQRLNASTDAQTAYTDSSVQSGTSYDYMVKSVDSGGNESAPSNTTTVAIP